jgi:sulfur-oxidizing protein SoxX
MVCKHYGRYVWLICSALAWWAPGARGADANAAVGSALITNAAKGNCFSCHVIPIAGVRTDAFGNLGPSLAGVGQRLTPAQIKARIVDPRLKSPDTLMPAYGSLEGLYRVQRAYTGKPILTDAEIDAVTAYLSALK